MLKSLIRTITPRVVLSWYHYVLARFAAVRYRHPSRALVVVGITGTNGKSSSTQLLGQILESLGETVGWTTTASFKVAKREWNNDKKMTMLGRFQTQRMLRDMVDAGCRYAIIETSSQGIAQSRHIGIEYDVAAITNLTPEHIESHGGFESYKKAKMYLFDRVAHRSEKQVDGAYVPTIAVANRMDEHADDFLQFGADQVMGFGIAPYNTGQDEVRTLVADQVRMTPESTVFSIEGHVFTFNLSGRFQLENAMLAITIAHGLGWELSQLVEPVAELQPIPGRLEPIQAGQPFSVIVDYAYEPAALEALYHTIDLMEYNRLIHVTGSAGGGRDVARRRVIGQLAARHDDITIVTNEDPYDEDPQSIIDEIVRGAEEAGMRVGETLFPVLDRREAIEMAVTMAEKNDIVLITGKGSEPVMAIAGGKTIPWDDRDVARDALSNTTNAGQTSDL